MRLSTNLHMSKRLYINQWSLAAPYNSKGLHMNPSNSNQLFFFLVCGSTQSKRILFADSLPYTSIHWWEWSPSQAAGRRCDSLYRTCHTPASSCPLQDFWHKNGIKTLSVLFHRLLKQDSGLCNFINTVPYYMTAIYINL